MRGPFLSPCTGETPTIHLSNSSPVITFIRIVTLCVCRLIPPLNQLDLLRNLKNKSGLSFRCVICYTVQVHTVQSTATQYCNKLLQHSPTTQYHNTVLQHSTTTQYCNKVPQHSPTTQYYNKLPEHSTVTQYYNTLLQQITTTQYYNTVLQKCLQSVLINLIICLPLCLSVCVLVSRCLPAGRTSSLNRLPGQCEVETAPLLFDLFLFCYICSPVHLRRVLVLTLCKIATRCNKLSDWLASQACLIAQVSLQTVFRC